MSSKKYVGFVFAVASIGIAAVANGCSSSSSKGASADAGSEASVIVHKEAGPVEDSGEDAEAGAALFDGTTGKECSTDTDCNATADVNVCSNGYGFQVTGVKSQLWPTPVCLVPIVSTGNCDPCGISAGGTCGDDAIWGCDSDPSTLDPTTSPGLCLPNSATNPVANQGICLPSCHLTLDGAAPTGCPGKDTCVAYTWLLTSSGVQGLGFCQGSCQADADCSALGSTYKCQTDIGFCTTTPVTRQKTIGAACTGGSGASSDSTLGNCNCESNTTTNAGYCTSSCVIGGTPCPEGYVCDGFYPNGPLQFGDASTEPAITEQNTGAVGTCIAPCTLADGGAPDSGSADGGGACPGASTCQKETLAGPDCLP